MLTSPITGMPKQIVRGTRSSLSLDSLLNSRHHTEDAGPDCVLGFLLPPFQRPAVWTPEQQARFIESLYMGFPLGEIVLMERRYEGRLTRRPLIDGQQRLRALEAWVDGQLVVCGQRFTDLPQKHRDHFGFLETVGVLMLDSHTDEETLKFIYERLNFGGTPHAPEFHPSIYRRVT